MDSMVLRLLMQRVTFPLADAGGHIHILETPQRKEAAVICIHRSIASAPFKRAAKICRQGSNTIIVTFHQDVVPVFPATRQFEFKGAMCTRSQFPLSLAYT